MTGRGVTTRLLSRVRPSAEARIFRSFYKFSGKCPAPRQHAPASSSVRASTNEIQIRSYAASAQCHVLILHLKCIFCTLKPFILNCSFPDAASQQPGPSGTTTAIVSDGSGGLNSKVTLISGSALFVKPGSFSSSLISSSSWRRAALPWALPAIFTSDEGSDAQSNENSR